MKFRIPECYPNETDEQIAAKMERSIDEYIASRVEDREYVAFMGTFLISWEKRLEANQKENIGLVVVDGLNRKIDTNTVKQRCDAIDARANALIGRLQNMRKLIKVEYVPEGVPLEPVESSSSVSACSILTWIMLVIFALGFLYILGKAFKLIK